ncbi:MAG: CapA family protein [Atopobiaceae bacterium]|nr:CapA family protein [Atopobiaceae bacterium]
MSDINNNENELTRLSGGSYYKYSRSAGVASYRKRRRQGKIFRFVVSVLLIAVMSVTAFLFGRRLMDDKPLTGAGYIEQEDEIVEVPEPEEAPTLQPTQITLLMAGDVVMNDAVVQSGLKESGAYGFDHLFMNLRGELSSFDLRLVDQETGLAGSKFGFGAWMPLNAPQELGRAEVSAGFNVILRATDHTLDNGTEGVHNELAWWQSEYPNLPLLGVAEPDPAANPGLNDYVNNVYVYEKEGFKVAVLNHSWAIDEVSHGVVSPLTEDKIAADVQKARDAGADIIVACPHWGWENEAEPNDEEKNFAQVYANHGVDVVIGTHPRVLQRTEILEGPDGHKTVCYYSLGCLISSLYSQNFLGGLAEVTLARDESGACSVQSAVLKPVVTHRGYGEDYTVYLLSDYTDELTYSSWDYDLTPAEATRRCTEILGEGYNAEAFELRIL